MIAYEDECVSCELPCLGSNCPNRNVSHQYCDCCGDEVDKLYWFKDEEFCLDCVRENILEILDEVGR